MRSPKLVTGVPGPGTRAPLGDATIGESGASVAVTRYESGRGGSA